MRRRVLAGAITFAVAFMLCATAYGSGSGESTGIVPGDGKPFGKYEPAIEMRVIKQMDQSQKLVGGNPSLESYEVNAVNKQVLDTLGIKLKYDWVVPKEQFNTKWNLTIASGDLPDVLTMNLIQFQELTKTDVLRDMTQYVDQYTSPTLKMLYDWDENFTRKAGTIGGKLLSVPITGTSPDNSPIFWIRKDWLDKVGMQTPTTMDELLKVARAFANNDPDGNGKNDTYAMALNKTLGGGLSDINGFLNGYGAYFDIWVKDGDKLVYSSIQPQVKTALLALQKMYTEKLIDPEFSVKDPVKEGEMVVSGKVGLLYGRTWACYVNIKDSHLKDLKAQWLPNQVPGVAGAATKVQASASLSGMTFVGVNKKYAHPEAAVKLVNLYATNYYGAKSTDEWNTKIHYQMPDGSWVSMIHLPAIEIRSPWNDYNQYLQLKAALAANDRNKLMPYVQVVWDMVTKYTSDPTQRQNLPAYLQVGPNGSQSVIEKYRTQNRIVLDEFLGFKTPAALEKETTLQAKILEVYTRIIMGESIDEFDKMVKDWYALGGDQITAEVNDWYKKNR
jgi:putative aldouronate transport system substrate-binding protein